MSIGLGELSIASAVFEPDGRIPDHYTGVGADVSPPLSWRGVPPATRELALICHDVDAPLPHGWTHWIVYRIPPDASGIAAGGADGLLEGINDFGNRGWNGPLPPEGHGLHRYYFWLYALAAELDALAPVTRLDLLAAIDGRVLEQARTVGTYSR